MDVPDRCAKIGLYNIKDIKPIDTIIADFFQSLKINFQIIMDKVVIANMIIVGSTICCGGTSLIVSAYRKIIGKIAIKNGCKIFSLYDTINYSFFLI